MGAKVREKPPGSGNFYVCLDYQTIRKSKKCANKKEAESAAKVINAQILAGTFNLGTKTEKAKTVSEYADIWLNHTTIKPATKSNYESLLKVHINPDFATTPVDKVTRADIKNFLKLKLKGGYSLSTVKNIKAALYNIFEAAFDAEVIRSNPASRIGELVARGQKGHKEDRIKFFTPEELAKLLDAFKREKTHKHYLFCLLLARTGMRVGEACALRWRDIDFDAGKIHIRQAKSRTEINTPKSGKLRSIEMSTQLADELRKARMEMVSKSLSSGKRSEYIFPGTTGATIDPTAWRRRHFEPLCQKLGLGGHLVKDLRHTYASLLLHHGKSLKFVQAQLGHHSITITADTYSHLIPEQKGGIDVLDDAADSATTPPQPSAIIRNQK